MKDNTTEQPQTDEFYDVCYVVADDDDEDLLLMRSALSRLCKPLPVREFHDGQQVIDYLNGNTAIRDDHDTHWLLVLDMNMPRLNGLETLRAIRQNADWNSIPVLLFTDAHDESLIEQALASGANGCIVKPMNLQEYSQLFDRFFRPYLQ